MAKPTIGRIALMSIHPQFADAILSGEKQVEFRKRPLAEDVTHVLIYATAPVCAVVGVFVVAGQTTAAPSTLWRQFGRVAGINRGGFFDYYKMNRRGTGIRVGRVSSTHRPLSLEEAMGISRPPQSFQYVSADRAQKVFLSIRNNVRQAAA